MKLDKQVSGVARKRLGLSRTLGFSLLLIFGLGAGTGCSRESTATKSGGKKIAENKTSQSKASKVEVLLVDQVAAALPQNCPLVPRWAIPFGKQTVSKIWFPKWGGRVLPIMLVQTSANELAAIRRKDGIMLWRQKLTAPLNGSPAFSEFGVYFILKNQLFGLDIYTGKVLWQNRLPFAPSGGLQVHEILKDQPVFYIPSLDNRIYALKLQEEIWPPEFGATKLTQKDLIVRHLWTREAWRYPASAQIVGEIDFSSNTLYIADYNRRVHIVSTNEFTLGKPSHIRNYTTQGLITAGPKAIGPYLLVPSRDRSLYCLSRREAAFVWRYYSGHILEKVPQLVLDNNTNKKIFALKCGKTGPLVGLGVHNGKPRWTLPDGEQIVGLLDEAENPKAKRAIMVVHNRDGSLSGNYASTGKQVWRFPAQSFNLFVDNTREPRVYATLDKGSTLCALRKRD